MVRAQPLNGKLWLGPLPVYADADWLAELNVTLAVCCLRIPLQMAERGGKRSKQPGYIPNTVMQVVVPVADMMLRSGAMRDAWHVVESTLAAAGEGVLVHCLAGVRRGPVAAAVFRAVLLDEHFGKATEHFERVRAVEYAKVWKGRQGNDDLWAWAESMTKTLKRTHRLPQIEQCAMSETRQQALIHAMVSERSPLCTFSQQPGRQKSLFQGNIITGTLYEAATLAFMGEGKLCALSA